MTKPDHAEALKTAQDDQRDSNLAACYLDLHNKHEALKAAAREAQDANADYILWGNDVPPQPTKRRNKADAELRKLLGD